MNFVDLPNDVELGIVGIVVALVAFISQLALAYVPWLGGILNEYKEEIAMVLATAFITWFESAVPTELGDVAIQAVKLLLVIFATLGLFVKTARRRKVKGFVKE
jgi:hypothetical protein